MNLIQEVRLLGEKSGLSTTEMKELEDFVDNYIGTTEESYIPNKDYYELHKIELKPIWRKRKEKSKFGTLINILRPHINSGVINLLG